MHSAKLLIEAVNLPLTPEELLSEMDTKLHIAFAQIQPLPGVMRLVKHLQLNKIPMAVGLSFSLEKQSRLLADFCYLDDQIATGSKASNFDIKRAILPALFEPFGSNFICGDDPVLLGKGKPGVLMCMIGAFDQGNS